MGGFQNVSTISIILLFTFCSCNMANDIKARYRLSKSTRIELGMSPQAVIDIVGQPDTIIYFDNPNCCPAYLYEINDDRFGFGDIRFDSLSKVISIRFPNNYMQVK
jgi:hypothetical protein